MNLQGRNLSSGTQGADVALLHTALRQLGLTIVDAEVTAQSFGASTHAAVQLFQKQHGLPPTGVVDVQTATVINAEVDKLARVHTAAAGTASGVASTPPAASRLNPPPTPTTPASGSVITPAPTQPPATPIPIPATVATASESVSSSSAARMKKPPLPRFIVRGRLSEGDASASNGESPVPGMRVLAYDKDMRSEELLGETVSGADGQYQIAYTAAQFKRAEKKSADLVVRAFRRGEERALATSEVVFNARPIEVVNLTIVLGEGLAESEFELNVKTLAPLQQALALADLTDADVRFLNGETKIPALQIALLSAAHKHAATTGVAPEAFYGLLRQNLPSALPALLLQQPQRLRDGLQRSLDEKIIPQAIRASLENILAELQELLKREVVDKGYIPLLQTSRVPPETQKTFLTLALDQHGSRLSEEFWTGLRQHPEFAANGFVDDIRFSLEAGLFTRNNVALTNALQDLRRQGKIKTIRDLAKLKSTDWEAMISSSRTATGIDFPPEVVGETEPDRIQWYGQLVVETLKATFPADFVATGVAEGPVLDSALITGLLDRNPTFNPRQAVPANFNWGDMPDSARPATQASLDTFRRELNMFPDLDHRELLSKNANPLRQQLSDFFSKATDFDLGTTHIEKYLSSDKGGVLVDTENRDALVAQLKRIQRIFNVAPRWEHAQTLLGAGFHSALNIASVPLRTFRREIGPLIGDAAATDSVHGAASQRTRELTHIAAAVENATRPLLPRIIGEINLKDSPTLSSLFGSMDMCECEHCQSVYGPAAYFVDLLQFLRKGSSEAFTALTKRRPDLIYIDLSCENAETPLPYLDLVNEILEYLVFHQGLPLPYNGALLARNTVNISADELSANPQYVVNDAYNTLNHAVYTTLLPFNRPIEVARAYLEQLGTTRYEVMASFQNQGTQTLADLELALEFLKITPEEHAVLVGDFTGKEYQVFGYQAAMGGLQQVEEFLLRADVEYPDLVELLKTQYVNPDQGKVPLPGSVIVLVSPDGVCDLDQTTIRHLDLAYLSPQEWLSFHRFIRLWRKLGWTMQEVDKALHSFGAPAVDDTLIANLARIKILTSQLDLPVVQVLSLWSAIDRFGVDSLYASLFQNRTVTNPVDPVFHLHDAFIKHPDDAFIKIKFFPAKLAQHLPAILSALRLSASDLKLLFDALNLSGDAEINIDNLSALYRHALLARALGIPVKDLLSLTVLMGTPTRRRQLQVSPQEKPLTAEEVESFVSGVLAVRSSGFTVADLNYVYRHLFDPASIVAPTQKSVSLILDQLRESLRKIIEETALVPDPTGDLLRTKLALAMDPALVPAAMDIIEKVPLTDNSAFIDKNFAAFVDSKGKNVLMGSVASVEDRRALVLPPLLAYLRDVLSLSVVKHGLCEAVPLDAALAELLLEKVLNSNTGDPAKRAIADFLALVGDGLLGRYFPNKDLSGAPTLSRVDANVQSFWGDASPDASLQPKAFSVSWTGVLRAEHDEDYIFYVQANDGVRLTINGNLLIDSWQGQGTPIEHSASSAISLKAGQVYGIQVDYYSASAPAGIELSWSSLSTPKSIISQSQLYSKTIPGSPDDAQQTYMRLQKAALLARKFGMTSVDAEYLSTHGADFGSFDLNALPLIRSDQTTDDSAGLRFESWERLRALFALRDALPSSDEITLTQLLEASVADLPKMLAVLTQSGSTPWDVTDVAYLMGLDGLAIPDSAFKNAAGLSRLKNAFDLVRKTGASVAQLRAWSKNPLTASQASDIVHTVKARYDDSTWLTVAKPLNDVLREKQRDAMVAYLLARPDIVGADITDINRLFEYLLIDVGMGAAMMTSRLKQAISSVQLFTQRYFLNLEANLAPGLLDDKQWEWTKNYRVWEANRKVFLYPENWIEPDLRLAKDKSPFFKEFENQLLQNEVTDTNVELALLSYLEKIDEVSRLEICGVYEENEGGMHVIHIFGRTSNQPAVYYYRRFDALLKVWTPWEKVTLDIEGDELIPVVWNRRLYLFWATFEEKPEKKSPAGGQSLEEWVKTKQANDSYSGQLDMWEEIDPRLDAARIRNKDIPTISLSLDIFYKEFTFHNAVPFPGPKPEDLGPQPIADAEQTQWIDNQKLVDSINGQLQVYNQAKGLWDQASGGLPFNVVFGTPGDGSNEIIFFDPPAKPADPGPLPSAKLASVPDTYFEIKLSWGEYRQNRWSGKKTAKAVLESHAYVPGDGQPPPNASDVQKQLPKPEDHRFITYLADDRLNLECFRQRDDLPAPNNAEHLGYFGLDGSNREALANSVSDEFFRRQVPEGSRMVSMWFVQNSGDTLKLPGHLPASPGFSVLGATPFPYRLSHPSYDLEPATDLFARSIYPFGYQDTLRSYVAFPTIDVGPVQLDSPLVANLLRPVGNMDEAVVAGIKGMQGNLVGNGTGQASGRAIADHKNLTRKRGMASSGTLLTKEATSADLLQVVETKLLDLKTYLKFHVFHHPHITEFIRRLNRDGIPGLLALDAQRQTKEDPGADGVQSFSKRLFNRQYSPSSDVDWNYPLEDVDFRQAGAYSVYNWELFFHAPLLIAKRLSENQQFQDAQKWFHYIFNPMAANSKLKPPACYWNTLPFVNNAVNEKNSIVALLKSLDGAGPDASARDEMSEEVSRWRENPFDPHLLARMRVTPYQKTVVMKYLENLIAAGDLLFGRDTIESINEATQLYVLAYNILGRRPATIPQRTKPLTKNYSQLLKDGIDDFSNALVKLENEFPNASKSGQSSSDVVGANDGLGTATVFYFCIPQNEKLLGYWDTVEDRLFKIRHSMNIDGIVRELPLFEPPIDPALLVKATAMGLDINSVLNDVNSPLPFYRFNVLAQKASEICNELKSIGGLLLSTLEKKDAEELAGLRAGFETSMLEASREVKKSLIQEAKVALNALSRSRAVVEERQRFYEQALSVGLIAHEHAHLDNLKEANDRQSDAMVYELSAQAASNIPDVTVGTSGLSPVMTVIFGGRNLVSQLEACAKYLQGQASDATYQASRAFIEGGFQRRADDWGLQSRLAAKELAQIDAQMAGAEIRIAIAEKELENHDKQIENSRAVEEFFREKYTNQELYGWMVSQISAVFFQTYKLACDVAKRAERAFRFERGLTTSNFIQFGYWDSLRQGLLSGERLHLDLKRMEMAYLDQNKREYEITKQISLIALDPEAFLKLRETGVCTFDWPETLFDMDFPGHYMRRIKAVSLTIPCVAGPYTSVNATLSLLSSKTRVDPNSQRAYPENEQSDDPRFVSQFGAVQSVATSHAQNDHGMFELNFRDERYLPFEGAGAVSHWSIDLPPDSNAFDFETISDVVFNVHYTARDGGKPLQDKARKNLDSALSKATFLRMFSLKHEFPNEWYSFLHPADTAEMQTLQLDLTQERFPFQFRGRVITIAHLEVFLKFKDISDSGAFTEDASNPTPLGAYASGGPITLYLTPLSDKPDTMPPPHSASLKGDKSLRGLPHGKIDPGGATGLGTWWLETYDADIKNIAVSLQKTVTATNGPHYRLKPEVIDDILMVCHYSAN